jgi:hypothetical protein
LIPAHGNLPTASRQRIPKRSISGTCRTNLREFFLTGHCIKLPNGNIPMFWTPKDQYLNDPFETEAQMESTIAEVAATLLGPNRIY